jgi:uncharacterized membrane protein (UPF0182 family)
MPEFDPRTVRRVTRTLSWTLVLLAVVVVGTGLIIPYTEWLWFRDDVRQPGVFSIGYAARGQLLLLGWLPTWALLHWSLSRALKTSMVYLDRPNTLGQVLLSNAVAVVQRKGPALVRNLSPLIGFFAGIWLSNHWTAFLAWRNSSPFGKVEPTFGIDLGWFVFTLPWISIVLGFAIGVFVLTTTLTVLVYAGMQALALFAKIELGRPHIRGHLSALIGISILLFAVRLWFRCFEAGFVPGNAFTGAGYSAMQQIGAQRIVAVLALIVGLLTLAVARTDRAYKVLGWAAGAWAIFSAVALGLYPTIVQRLRVDPDRLKMESPYAAQALAMTRFGYGLNNLDVRDIDVADEPTKAELTSSQETLDNMRLWDPDVLRQAIEGIQGLKPYYTFSDVDIDRYVIDGKAKMVMIAARDIRLEGLSANASNWVNQRLQYTHGYGVVASPVNASSAMGQPLFLLKDIPVVGHPQLKLDEPRIYFSDFRDGYGLPTSDYAVVKTKVPEFDFPSESGSPSHVWSGDGGVKMTPLARAAYAARFADGNLLVSGNVTAESRLLMRRGVIERAEAVYPWLRFDADPYIVVGNGRLVWILDGYTTTEMIPYSQRSAGQNGLNYIRNSVKITVDAYKGTIEAFAFEEDEPILKTWMKIYPKVVKSRKEFPTDLESHIRYPEDMLKLQANILAEYHVTDPVAFLNNADAWQPAFERGISGAREPIRPYYVQIGLPGELKASFRQILPFTPLGKTNMSGWLSAECDPDSYGQLVLFRYRKGAQAVGPEQMEAIFNQDKIIADINRQFENEQSQIVVGNLLVIPIGRSVMYVEPLFLRSRTVQAIPELKKVILAFKGKVVVGDSYAEALEKLTGETKEERNPAVPVPNAKSNPEAKAALGTLDQASAALRDGEFARYGELLKKLRSQLEALTKS